MDLIGTVISRGSCRNGMFTYNVYGKGMCETLYRPGFGPDELFETISQALFAGVDRDALSGWGVIVHVIAKDSVTRRELKGGMDYLYM